MGSVTLAAAVTMVRQMSRGLVTRGANVMNTNNESQKRLVWRWRIQAMKYLSFNNPC